MTRGVLFLVCTFLIFVVRLESPLLHVLDIHGLTGVTTFACLPGMLFKTHVLFTLPGFPEPRSLFSFFPVFCCGCSLAPAVG